MTIIFSGTKSHTTLRAKESHGVIDHADDSVRDHHLYNTPAWKRLLAARPHTANDRIKKNYTHGIIYSTRWAAVIFDGSYLYVSCVNSILQINAATMALAAVYDHAVSAIFYNLIYDGTYLYAAFGGSNKGVIRINTNGMTLDSAWTSPAENIYALTHDGTYLYAAGALSPIKVYRINTSTMESNAHFEAAAGINDCYALSFDGTYVYASSDITPAKVVQIETAGMTANAVWEGAAGQNLCRALAFDGTCIYAGLYVAADTAGKVVKITPVNMTTVATWTGAAGQNAVNALVFDGTYLYAGCYISPGQVIKINTASMASISTWTSDKNNIAGLGSDGKHIFIVYNTNPVSIDRKITGELDASD